MRVRTALVALVLLFCPFALCYGQLSFSSVSGESGYSAMRGYYKLDLDNNWILTPVYGNYRTSDSEDDQKGAISRYTLNVGYEITDNITLLAAAFYQPKVSGYSAGGYFVGARSLLAYRWWILQDIYLYGRIGQDRKKIHNNIEGTPLENRFKQVETMGDIGLHTRIQNFHIQTAWHKVIQYSSKMDNDISFNWADIPFMTAVVQGFIKQAEGVKLTYKSAYVSPYAAVVRYQYAEQHDFASAVSAGINIHSGAASISGGVEVFEPRKEVNRKTFFTVSIEIEI